LPHVDSMEEPTHLTKGIVSRLWDSQPINFPHEKPCVLVRNSLLSINLFFPFSKFSLSSD
jgi:hypothetical protein